MMDKYEIIMIIVGSAWLIFIIATYPYSKGDNDAD